MSSIHGHEVLNMMEGNNYNEDSLLKQINEKFVIINLFVN